MHIYTRDHIFIQKTKKAVSSHLTLNQKKIGLSKLLFIPSLFSFICLYLSLLWIVNVLRTLRGNHVKIVNCTRSCKLR